MRRLAVLCSIALVVALLPLHPVEVGGASPPPIQKKKAAPKKAFGGVVDGGIWVFTATATDGQQIRFRYIARDHALIDPNTQETIGKSEPIATNQSRVTFEKNSKFPAVFTITRKAGEEKPTWLSRTDYNGKSWAIKLVWVVN